VDGDPRPLGSVGPWFCVPGDPPLLEVAKEHHPDRKGIDAALSRLKSLLAQLGVTDVAVGERTVQADLSSDTIWVRMADLSLPKC